MAALLAVGTAHADVIVWSGSGASGTDPFGHSWQFGTGGGGKLFWGIPGLGAGTEVWAGSGTLQSMTFTVDTPGLTIDPNPVPTGFGGFDESTRFSNTSDGALWDRSIGGATVTFSASTIASLLEVGQSFFVNVGFIGQVRGPIDFTVTYVTVPEPGTLVLLGVAAVLAGTSMRRKRA
jgi:PEP-CTERM motif